MPKKKNPEKTKKPQFVHFVENKCEKKELEEYRKKDKEKLNIKKLVLRIRKYEDLIDDEARNYANSFASNMPEAESEENNELIERINFWDKEIHKCIKEMNLIKDANYYYDATVKYDAEDPLHPEPEERVNVALFKGSNNINEIADTLEEWTPNRKKVTAEDLEEVKVNLFDQLTKAQKHLYNTLNLKLVANAMVMGDGIPITIDEEEFAKGYQDPEKKELQEENRALREINIQKDLANSKRTQSEFGSMQNTTRFIRKYFEPRFEEWVCAHLTDHFNNEKNTVDDSRIKNIFQESKYWKDLVSECERHQSNYNENLEPYDVKMPKDRAFRDARIKIYEKHNITTQGVGRRSEN